MKDLIGVLVIAGFFVAVAVIHWIARRLPMLGMAGGLALAATPVFFWAWYDAGNFRSEGSAGGLILWALYWFVALIGLGVGLSTLKVAWASWRGEDLATAGHRGGAGYPMPAASVAAVPAAAPSPVRATPAATAKRQGGKRLDDALWLTDPARTAGMLRLARGMAQRGERVALGGWNALAVRALREADTAPPLEILEPHELNPARLGELGRGSPYLMLLLAGAPLSTEGEEQLLAQCGQLPCEIRLQLHHSCDDRVLAAPAAAKARERLKAMARTGQPVVNGSVTSALDELRGKRAI